MTASKLNDVIQHIRKVVLLQNGDGLTDGQLLDEFVSRREQAALAALVRRHGSMVWAVCSRTLRNNHDAEDAFQSTFLVLVRKATVVPKNLVGNWLYGVARQTALNARAAAIKRRNKETPVADIPAPSHEEKWHDLLPFLDQELSRLPDKYRAVIVLCDLEGKSRKEAAKQLAVPEGTVAGNLARARTMLAKRMARHSPEITGAALAAALSQNASAVPPMVESCTIKAVTAIAAGQAAADLITAKVIALTEGVLKTMLLKQLKVVTAILLVMGIVVTFGGGHLLTHFSAAAQQVQPPNREKAAVGADSPKGGPKQPQRKPKDDPASVAEPKPEKVVIRGRVLDADGKAIANADVAAVGWVEDALRKKRALPSLVEGKADQEGRFQIELPERAGDYTKVNVAATSAGRALSSRQLDADTWRSEIELRLHAEHKWRGQLIDLQGVPAAGVRVEISNRFDTYGLYETADPSDAIGGFASGLYSKAWNPERKLNRWRMSATTDAQGQFVLHGLRADWHVALKVDDERFGPQEFLFAPSKQNGDKGFVGVLAPKRVLEGVVTSAEDGKPVPNAELAITTAESNSPGVRYHVESRADDSGRFRVALSAGKHVQITAHAPTGSPYLGLSKSMTWPDSGVIKQEMNLALPQGVVVRGTVKEVPSGKPVLGAKVRFQRSRMDNPFNRNDVVTKLCVSDADGVFNLTLPPGPGHLLIDGPTADYLHNELTNQELLGSFAYPHRRNYFDAVVPLKLKPQITPYEVAATLRRGVTLSGNVVGPNHEPVREAMMLCRSFLEDHSEWNGTHSKRVVGGRFSLPGCDPEKMAEVFFVDEKNRWGGVAKLSGKDVGKPITVRLEPCGTVSMRLIDALGKPISKFDAWVQIVITPGADVSMWDIKAIDPATGKTPISAELAWAPYSLSRGETDTEGRITFPCLIPGATYRLGGQSATTGGTVRLRGDFGVVPGQVLDFGDIEVKARKK